MAAVMQILGASDPLKTAVLAEAALGARYMLACHGTLAPWALPLIWIVCKFKAAQYYQCLSNSVFRQ